ncbi:MAG: type I 3-dehydroquinate dehydratase [Acidobacteriota bacterium]
MGDRILPRPALVASLAPRDLSDARRLVALVPARAGAVEYRLDLAADRIPAEALLALDPRPAILTWRSAREGGRFAGSPEEYRARLIEAYDAGATVDVEHASGLLSPTRDFSDRSRVVVSAHFPFGVPDGVLELLRAMRASEARFVKLVVGAADLRASLAVVAIPSSAPAPELAVFPMGPASAPGRILAAHAGSSLVYGSVETGTARGQLPLAELIDVYGVDRPFPPEALYGIVAGDPSGSLSPLVHNALFRSRGLPSLYLPLPVTDFDRERPPDLEASVPFRGFSVTRPWKRSAAGAGIPSEDVRAAGAANTLYFGRGRWRAENTDVDGVFDPLADHDTGEGRSAVVLGAGGTARAAILAARRIGYEVAVASRRDEAADLLASEMGVDSIAWGDVEETEADLYVNATPVGSGADDPAAIPDRVLENRPLVFDCAYRRGSETATVAAARRAGCAVIDGLRMFAAQALRQARLFGVADARQAEIDASLSGERAV